MYEPTEDEKRVIAWLRASGDPEDAAIAAIRALSEPKP